MFKLVAIDLDDTLLTHDLKVSERNREVIKRAVNDGIVVTIATGRMMKATWPFVNALGISVPVIMYQGAVIYDTLKRKNIYSCPLPIDSAKKVLECAENEGIHAQVYLNDEYYIKSNNKYSDDYYKLSGVHGIEVGDLVNFLNQPPIKILWIDEPDRIQKLSRKYKEYFNGSIEIAISKKNFLEFTHPDVNKGRALKQLSSVLNVKQSEIIAIGDSFNDLSMIKYAGVGVAMGNSSDIIKNNADYVTCTNDEDGVAAAMEKLIYNK